MRRVGRTFCGLAERDGRALCRRLTAHLPALTAMIIFCIVAILTGRLMASGVVLSIPAPLMAATGAVLS